MHPVTCPSFPESTKSIMHEAQKVSEPPPCCRPALRRKVAASGIRKDAEHHKIKPMRAVELIIDHTHTRARALKFDLPSLTVLIRLFSSGGSREKIEKLDF